MAETPVPQEPARESSVFPVTKEVVDKALADIARDPAGRFLRENMEMSRSNPNIKAGLSAVVDTMGTASVPYLEGAMWTYKILRESAVSSGQTLPRISIDSYAAYLMGALETINAEGGNATSLAEKQFAEVAEEDVVFGDAIKEITKYEVDRNYFTRGVVDVYYPLKKEFEAQTMNREFGVGQ